MATVVGQTYRSAGRYSQSSDGTVDRPVSLHRLWTAVWIQHPGTTENGDCGVINTRGHYTSAFVGVLINYAHLFIERNCIERLKIEVLWTTSLC